MAKTKNKAAEARAAEAEGFSFAELDVFSMTTRQLRAEIRARTKALNAAIAEYQQNIASGKEKPSRLGERAITTLQATAGVKGRKGNALGTGLENKTKLELQNQLQQIRRFEKNDIFTPEGRREWSRKTTKAYMTFKERYGDISRADYEQFASVITVIKNYVAGYDSEQLGKSLARSFSHANKAGKKNFLQYVKQASTGTGKSGETVQLPAKDIARNVVKLLQDAGEWG